MPDTTLNDDLADGLLGGPMPAGAVPGDYRAVAALFEAARGPSLESELASEGAVVGAAVAVVRSTLAATRLHAPDRPVRVPRRRRVPGRLTAAAAAGVVILGGSAAAAATDSLPGPAQTAVSDALSHVGISVPKPNAHANKHALENHGHSGAGPGHSGSAPGHQGTSGSGPDVQSGAPAEFGLCTAFLSGTQGGTSGHRNSSTAFTKLIAAHGGSVASTTTYCRGVVAAHPGGAQSEGTDDQQGDAPSGSGQAPGSPPAGGGPQSGKPSTAGPPAGTGSPSSSGAPSSPGANGTGAGHAPSSATTQTTTASTSSTVNGHSKTGSAHG